MQGILLIDGTIQAVALSRRGAQTYVTAEGAVLRITARGDVEIDGLPTPLEWMRCGASIWVHVLGETHEFTWRTAVDHLASAAHDQGDKLVRAPMPGAVVSILVTPAQKVEKDDPLIVIESMKLETTLRAPMSGVVSEVPFGRGESFERHAVLIALTEAA